MVGGYIFSAAQHGMAFALLVLILVARFLELHLQLIEQFATSLGRRAETVAPSTVCGMAEGERTFEWYYSQSNS